MRRITSSLTYANVVSTLCLFILLGGGAYAARRAWIDGNDLKPRSVGAGKIKRDTLTGRQINESRLGRVPNAAKLDGKPASAFQPAGNYQAAGSYLAADGTAANAAKLGGRDASAYVAADRVVAGSGVTSATPPETVLSYPRLGLTVTTDGDADSDHTVTFVNNGPALLEVSQSFTAGIIVIRPGESRASSDASTATPVVRAGSFVVRQGISSSPGDPKLGLVLTCGWDFGPNIVNCAGIGVG